MAPQHAAWPSKGEEREVKATVQTWLIDWFVSRSKLRKAMPESVCDIDYFEAGWLTSMEVVEFVTEIEQQFGMQFSDRDLQDPRFVTIAGLAELISERSAQATPSG
jgi:acyl carrier protein